MPIFLIIIPNNGFAFKIIDIHSGWNLFEWLIILLYLGYLYFNNYRLEYGERIRLQIVEALNNNNVNPHIPLDNLAYFTSFSQDVCSQLL